MDDFASKRNHFTSKEEEYCIKVRIQMQRCVCIETANSKEPAHY